MAQHSEKRVFPYTPEQVFDLVADVAHYPDFLPWCLDARIFETSPTSMKADLRVGYKALHDTFTSIVQLDRPRSIVVTYGAGPLSHLHTVWRFDPVGKGACEVHFDVDFCLKSPILGALLDAFFERAFFKMVEAFESRAAQIYGEDAGSV
ncbi:MAG: type II toxin-antitoxin system RatA family toxin [Bdellovibrionales bacterium]|jgi:coenzyme Q-binding protein COQ10